MSLFSLPTQPQSPDHGVSAMYYSKVEPNQPIRTDAGFGSQRIQFQINPAANEWFIPNRSYFRIRVTLGQRNADDSGFISIGAKVDGSSTSADEVKNQLAPAYGLCSKLFSQCAFQVGSTTVCSVSSNLPQVDALHKRTTLSRVQLESSEGLYQSDPTKRIDQFVGSTAAADRKTTQSELVWSPPLGISDVAHGLPASQYTWTFVANPNFVRDAVDGLGVERLATGGDATNAYEFKVESMVLYACYARGRDGSDEKYSLNMKQLSCQALSMSTGSTSLQLKNFDTPSDTAALSIAFQASSEENKFGGKSRFVIEDGKQRNLGRWYVSYDNSVFPQEQNEDRRDVTTNFMAQRYRDTSTQTGLYFSPGGPETLGQWLNEAGPYYYVNWPRTQGSATRVQVNAELNSAAVAFDCLLFSIAEQAFLVRSSDAKVRKVEMAE